MWSPTQYLMSTYLITVGWLPVLPTVFLLIALVLGWDSVYIFIVWGHKSQLLCGNKAIPTPHSQDLNSMAAGYNIVGC